MKFWSSDPFKFLIHQVPEACQINEMGKTRYVYLVLAIVDIIVKEKSNPHRIVFQLPTSICSVV